MKRFLTLLAASALLCACGSDREHTLKVYNWSDYMDVTAIEEFEQWYEEQTGEPVKVILQTFDVNETMLSKIEKGQEDFELRRDSRVTTGISGFLLYWPREA